MMKVAMALLGVLGVHGMDTSSQPGEDLTVVTNTPAVHRVSWTFYEMDS
jgi:hypothetical protein